MIIVVCGIIYDDRDRLLVTRRAKGKFSGQWEFPGGKLELGESCEECLCRELREELCISVSVKSSYLMYQYFYPTFSIYLISMKWSFEGGVINLIDHDQFSLVTRENHKIYKFIAGDTKIVNKIRREGI